MATIETAPDRRAERVNSVGAEPITAAEAKRPPEVGTPNRRRGRAWWVIGGLIVLAIFAYFAYWVAEPSNQAGVTAQQSNVTGPSPTTPPVGDTAAGAPPAPAATAQ